ncbi:BRI1 kinase inhibitor 1 [Rosa chinensis]|uniref:BRI1 kinase inhibitor 1 n=1 Tax=Rosa chinensis TaxID=74649 RepID=UPI000D092596|nr:BRI1 kinase inhibitor 1 [Rosa chinensis]
MDTHLLEKTREKAAGNNMLQEKPQSPVTASPPSASSSPSHEFSFTVSLHHSSSTSIPDHSKNNNKAKTPPSFAIDLSPADDIFFHGHLLPLQFLSHLPISPRSSTNSLDSFTLPIRDLVDDQEPTKESNNCSTALGATTSSTRRRATAAAISKRARAAMARRGENQVQVLFDFRVTKKAKRLRREGGQGGEAQEEDEV